MGLLNMDKNIIIDLDKLKYKSGEEVKGNISFDFGTEAIETDKIEIRLIKKIRRDNFSVGSEGVKSSNSVNYRTFSSMTLLGKGNYKKEKLDFNFLIPHNAVLAKGNLKELLNKFNIKGTPADILIALFNFAFPKSNENETFYIEARLDIPWGIDITEKKIIGIEAN